MLRIILMHPLIDLANTESGYNGYIARKKF